jgi:recombination protein RecT
MSNLSPQLQASNLKSELVQMTASFQAALPTSIPAERFIRTIVTAVQMEPKLLAADRKSLFLACMKAAQDGLLLDGREAGLSVYRNRDTGIQTVAYLPMVGGIMKKIRQSGVISSIRAHCVYQGDEFEYWLGDDERIDHKPNLDAQGGKILAAYAIARFKDGDIQREVMSWKQIEKIAAVATGIGKACWKSEPGEMAKKTVIRRLSKRLPSSNDVQQVFENEGEQGQPVAQVNVMEEAAAQPQLAGPVTVADLNRQIAAAPEPVAVDAEVVEPATAPAPAVPQEGEPAPAPTRAPRTRRAAAVVESAPQDGNESAVQPTLAAQTQEYEEGEFSPPEFPFGGDT